MTFRHVIVSLAAVTALAACSNDDTIVSLNVTASDAVPVVDRLHVTITQGSRKHVSDITPPTETPTGENAPPPSIQNSFFERITLPDSFSEDEALVEVEAQQEGGAPFDPPISDATMVKIEPEGVVAAYVKLDVPTPPPDGEGGAGGQGNGEGGAGGNGG